MAPQNIEWKLVVLLWLVYLYYIKGILFVELHSIREAFSSVTADGQEKKKKNG